MTIFTNAFGSLSTGSQLFASLGSQLRLPKFASAKHGSTTFAKGSTIDGTSTGSSEPSIIGKASAGDVECGARRWQDDDDDRWMQVECGSPVRFRSCRKCTFLSPDCRPKCERCGISAPEKQRTDDDVAKNVPRSPVMENAAKACDTENSLTKVIIADAPLKPVSHCDSQISTTSTRATSSSANDKVQTRSPDAAVVAAKPSSEGQSDSTALVEDESDWSNDASSEQSEQSSEDFSDDESIGSDMEVIPGCLETAPPVGTQVKVLYDDEYWHLARVTKAEGSMITVAFQDGRRTALDLDDNAVRLADYVDDDEDYVESLPEATSNPKHECDQSAKMQDIVSKPSVEAWLAEEDERTGRGDSCETDEESDDEEQIEGTLDEVSAVGTLVKVLFEDDKWYRAQIIDACGTKATVQYEESGDIEEVDFDDHAVRLVDFIGQDERLEEPEVSLPPSSVEQSDPQNEKDAHNHAENNARQEPPKELSPALSPPAAILGKELEDEEF